MPFVTKVINDPESARLLLESGAQLEAWTARTTARKELVIDQGLGRHWKDTVVFGCGLWSFGFSDESDVGWFNFS